MFPEGILFKYWHEVEGWHNKKDAVFEKQRVVKRYIKHIVYSVLILPPLFVLSAGGIAETTSILALNNQHATAMENAIVVAFFVPLPAVAALCIMILVILRSMGET